MLHALEKKYIKTPALMHANPKIDRMCSSASRTMTLKTVARIIARMDAIA